MKPLNPAVGSRRILFMAALALRLAAQTGPTGTWQAEIPGRPTPWRTVLLASGSNVFGATNSCATRNPGAFELFDGHFDGSVVTFKCKSSADRPTLTFTGRLSSDEIAFRSSWEDIEQCKSDLSRLTALERRGCGRRSCQECDPG